MTGLVSVFPAFQAEKSRLSGEGGHILMVEQPQTVKRHHHAVFVAGHDDVVVADRAARLGDVAHAALVGALDIVAEGEESVGAKRNAALTGESLLLFFAGQGRGTFGKELLPGAVREDVHRVVRQIDVDGVVPVGPADVLHKGEM